MLHASYGLSGHVLVITKNPASSAIFQQHKYSLGGHKHICWDTVRLSLLTKYWKQAKIFSNTANLAHMSTCLYMHCTSEVTIVCNRHTVVTMHVVTFHCELPRK